MQARKLLVLFLGLSLLLGPISVVHAQGQATADLYPPDTSAFPTVTALLDVFNTQGVFATGLKSDAISVIEDGKAYPVDQFTEQMLPAQIVVAVNSGPALDVRDAQAISRFQRIVQVLSGWVQTLHTGTPDDMSLVSTSGEVISHAKPNDFLVSLNTFKPNFRSTTPNLQSLAIAIDTVSAQTAQPGMKRAILFITPHMDDPNIDTALQPLIQRAAQSKVRVFVWFVDTDTYFYTTSAAAFNTLASQTGGVLFAYSGTQPFPDPESYFAPLRRVYTFKYTSKLTSGNQHTLQVLVQLPSGQVTSNAQQFNIDVQPPNPIFVNPPLQITRQAPASDPFNTELLLPEVQPIQIIIEFPDQHKRPIVRTTLYVDGKVVAENKSEPFDHFNWDLSDYQLSGEHQIMVEAVDSLGLSKTSVAIPITVTVVQPPRGVTAIFAKYRQPIMFVAIALAGLALLFVLFTGRLRISLRARREARRAFKDPLTQPVAIPAEAPAPAAEKVKRRTTRQSAAKLRPVSAPALLIRIMPDGQPAIANPIPLAEKEITFGTDPVQSSQVIDDPSISPLHARMKRTDDDGFVLFDNNSVAGTWVNYEPVPREGHRLQHGDMINFGQMSYRFELRTPPATTKPKVSPEKPVE
ncbi:MAG TPA: FHA domain-containing protein [Anaerolineales bacterium]|nr:FHA domain-containing protein [Anaerolineales bacterium]